MCGVAGYVSPGGVDEGVLRAMTATLRHRGPDSEGYYFSPGHQAGLGHRRLSIIDLAGGQQPMANEDGTVWVAFNGEIYNFADLRRELEGKGHRFATNSDTEAIVHGYEEWGDECVRRFNGMFAFALWDERRRRLLCARDRMGKKPLYYAAGPTGLVFGSELKALLRHPQVSRQLDLGSVAQYLVYEYVPAPHSILRDVRKLPPAHSLAYDAATGRLTVSPYWDLTFRPDDRRGEADYAEELRQRLKEAVRRRLVSDVPLGVFLSGGIDSSAIVALMAELVPARQIKTFTVTFIAESFDESDYARAVADLFGTDHHEQVFHLSQMLEVLPEVAAWLDEPFGDASLLPTYLLSRFTRQHVTVALGGDGGDELFAGYPTFVASRYAALYQRVPRPVSWSVERLAGLLPVSTNNFSFDFKVRQFLKGIPYPEPVRTQVWLGSFSPPELDEVLSDEVRAELKEFDPYEVLRPLSNGFTEAPDPAANGSRLNELIYRYCRSYLADDILFKVDRASMAASLEARAPFLDREFVEFVNNLPPNLKLRGKTTKYLLKRALEPKLPYEVLYRAKKGFGVPVAQWLRGEARGLAEEVLTGPALRQAGLFRPETVDRLLSEHVTGLKNNRKPLWTLLMFALWHRNLVSQ
jgi:asparagine synthase (glutamine-hydrolysing)